MTSTRCALAVLAVAVLAGCGGKVRQLTVKDGAGAEKPLTVTDSSGAEKPREFPNGTVFGGASQQQAGELAQLVVDTSAATAAAVAVQADAGIAATGRVETEVKRVGEGLRDLQAAEKRDEEALERLETGQKGLAEDARKTGAVVEKTGAAVERVDAGVKKAAEGQARIEETSRETLEVAKKTWDTTRMIIDAYEKVSRRQGTGEVTVFFPAGSSEIARGGLQERRVVEFADWLGRESRGRKIMFVSVGSASATGPRASNEQLAKKRSEALLGVLDKYLVNVPHEYVKIYGTGDAYSPKGVAGKEHERYQHARLIAFFEKGQEPALPAEP